MENSLTRKIKKGKVKKMSYNQEPDNDGPDPVKVLGYITLALGAVWAILAGATIANVLNQL
jgi:hypothetical protein